MCVSHRQVDESLRTSASKPEEYQPTKTTCAATILKFHLRCSKHAFVPLPLLAIPKAALLPRRLGNVHVIRQRPVAYIGQYQRHQQGPVTTMRVVPMLTQPQNKVCTSVLRIRFWLLCLECKNLAHVRTQEMPSVHRRSGHCLQS